MSNQTIALAAPSQQTQDGIADIRRDRDLYKYFTASTLSQQPQRRNSIFPSERIHNIQEALKPFAQLVAIQTRSPKVMINVISRDIMYSLVEVSHSLTGTDDDIPDEIFLGCSSVPLKGRICELTIEAEKTESTRHYPMFVVENLAQDPRFCEMSIVKEHPGYRYYAGTPLTSREGVNIGSLAIMDFVVRKCSEAEEKCLGDAASQIMALLEINRAALEGLRSRKMALGLDYFVTGKTTLDDEERISTPVNAWKRSSRIAYGVSDASLLDVLQQRPDTPKARRTGTRRRAGTNSRSGTSSAESSDQTISTEDAMRNAGQDPVQADSHSKIFLRAANLLRECLDLGEGGGVMFVSVGNSPAAGHGQKKATASTVSSSSPSKSPSDSFPSSPEAPEATILASSTDDLPFGQGEVGPELKGAPKLRQDVIQELFKRYPVGRLWAFGVDLTKLPSSDEDATAQIRSKLSRVSSRKMDESSILQNFFSGARQIMFSPLFDASLSGYSSACFVFSSSETRPLSSKHELNFLNSFCNTVTTELSRLDALIADKQKSDFVGTISHEMRSPLHGILASIEFLADSELSGFQRSLVDTVEACGRTLLDTINHVLDFSKINSFEKNWNAMNNANSRSKKRHHAHGLTLGGKALSQAPQILQLRAATDVSVILEEIVDGIAVGQTYVSGLDITDVSPATRGRGSLSMRRAEETHQQMDDATNNPVEIVLDIQQADWVFLTTPGSLRRVFMNTFGNAVKYTSKGSIRVHLQLKDAEDSSGESKMILTITDTGKGISPNFLSSKLYVPFSQENALSPGTGLGLSITKSIITMLGGSIDISSPGVGEGTTVQIMLPMKRPLPGSQSTTDTPLSGPSTSDDSVKQLRDMAQGRRIALVGMESDPDTNNPSSLSSVLIRYLRDWYNFELLQPEDSHMADIVITEDTGIDSLLLTSYGASRKRPAIFFLCSLAGPRRQEILQRLDGVSDTVFVLNKPLGPYRLAKALKSCLEQSRAATQTKLEAISEQSTPRTPAPAREDFDLKLQELDLGAPGNNDTATMVLVQEKEGFAASQVSQNAHMAIHTPSVNRDSASGHEKDAAFPFPKQIESPSLKRTRSATGPASPTSPSPMPMSPSVDDGTLPGPTEGKTPRLLLVDDNKINLKLLEMFVKRRGYEDVDMAEDGQEAVDAYTQDRKNYDIIFMDISMPKLNGFEATKAIRLYEAENVSGHGALIIALTGLGSRRDQADAFSSGCDIFLTKPVKFKDVGKLLDNWEAHRRLVFSERLINGVEASMVGGALTGPSIDQRMTDKGDTDNNSD